MSSRKREPQKYSSSDEPNFLFTLDNSLQVFLYRSFNLKVALLCLPLLYILTKIDPHHIL